MATEDRSRPSSQLAGILLSILSGEPGLSARELAREMEVTRRDVNRVLYARPDLFFAVGDRPPRWFSTLGLAEELTTPFVAHSAQPAITPPMTWSFDESAHLYEWQREALAAWEANGRRGIVEAVTGAGKTRLAIAAAARCIADGGKVAVVVPKIDLQRQWRAQFEEWLPTVRIGELGGGGQSPHSLASADVLIAIVNSASRHELGLGPRHGLLIADECHRVAAEKFRLALEEEFASRLGLSATVARPDGLDQHVLLPYFDRIVYSLDYQSARHHDVIARVKLAHIGVDLSESARWHYREISEEIKGLYRKLVTEFDVPESPVEEHFRAVNHLLKQSWNEPARGVAGRYMALVTERRRLVAEAPAKLDVIAGLIPAIDAADRALVFTSTVAGAEAVARVVSRSGVSAASFHGARSKDEREQLLTGFAKDAIHLLAAPQVLDEGIDVPAADLGIVLAASQSRRQMVQRMGRILRKKPDGRLARFALVYVRGTFEDPAEGAHEAFLGEMQEIAEDEEIFSASAEGLRDASEFLNRMHM